LEENLFPSMMNLNTRQELEEERRLFYVALTRAEQQVILSYSVSRQRWGKIIDAEPSRFLEEIDDKYLAWENPTPILPMNTSGLSADMFGDKPVPKYERKSQAIKKKLTTRKSTLQPIKQAQINAGNADYQTIEEGYT